MTCIHYNTKEDRRPCRGIPAEKKDAGYEPRVLLCLRFELCLGNRADRAFTGAGAAIDAGAFVDHILGIALGNCGDRTCRLAGAAADASVANHIRHCLIPSFHEMSTC